MGPLTAWRQAALAWVAALGLTGLFASAQTPPANAAVSYADLAPLLGQRCVMCHSAATASAGLRLDSLDALLRGSARGPVVKAGDPAGSELIRRLEGRSQPRMPMTGPPFLSTTEIALFSNWISAGMPAGEAGKAPPAMAAAPARPKPGEPVTYTHVAPLLAARCVKCHSDNGLMGPAPEGYRLVSYAATLEASDRARVVPGKPEASELIRRVRGQARPLMPMDGSPPLSAEDVQLLEDWIRQGAKDASGRSAPMPVGAAVRLHGTVDASSRLDGLPLVMSSSTRVDKNPRPGSYVQVRGRLDAGGQVVVDRLRAR